MAKVEVALLRTLAGRNIIASKVRYAKEIMIQPKCTVVMVSNFLPSHFAALQDEAIKNKLNVVILDQDYSVNTDNRITNFEDELLKYANEVFNWALYTPLQLSQHIVRGEFWSKYNRFEQYKSNNDSNEIVSFVLDMFVLQPYNPDKRERGSFPQTTFLPN